jgi:hypothetical protein
LNKMTMYAHTLVAFHPCCSSSPNFGNIGTITHSFPVVTFWGIFVMTRRLLKQKCPF